MPAMRSTSARAKDDDEKQVELQESLVVAKIDVKNNKGVIVDQIEGSRFRF